MKYSYRVAYLNGEINAGLKTFPTNFAAFFHLFAPFLNYTKFDVTQSSMWIR